MDEVNSNGLSVSFRVDDGVIEHNNREIIAKNVDPARISDNITYAKTDLKDFYRQIFGKALAEYNAKQTRVDRRINDYYEHIKKSGNAKLFYNLRFPNKRISKLIKAYEAIVDGNYIDNLIKPQQENKPKIKHH